MMLTTWIVISLALFVVVVIAFAVHQLRGLERRDPRDGWGGGQPFKVPE